MFVLCIDSHSVAIIFKFILFYFKLFVPHIFALKISHAVDYASVLTTFDPCWCVKILGLDNDATIIIASKGHFRKKETNFRKKVSRNFRKFVFETFYVASNIPRQRVSETLTSSCNAFGSMQKFRKFWKLYFLKQNFQIFGWPYQPFYVRNFISDMKVSEVFCCLLCYTEFGLVWYCRCKVTDLNSLTLLL